MGSDSGRMGPNAGMMQSNSSMMANHQQMNELMTKLMASMKTMQNEKDPAALKREMTEHNALLEQMRSHMMQMDQMMQQMPMNKNQPTTP